MTEWTVTRTKHQIRVAKTQCDGARLHIDDELLDTANGLYASEGEATRVGVFGENDEFRVEALGRPSEHTGAEIQVNGDWIVGDKVYAVASD